MTRTETLAQIDALPVSDAVKEAAKKFLTQLPVWVPEPNLFGLDGKHTGNMGWREPSKGTLWLLACDSPDGTNYYCAMFVGAERRFYHKVGVTVEEFSELLRQLTGMVALTGGG